MKITIEKGVSGYSVKEDRGLFSAQDARFYNTKKDLLQWLENWL